MAEQFPILFTGREVSYEPRSTGELERSKARFNERFIEGAKFKRAEKERDEDFYFKTMDVDPVQVMSAELTRLQEKSLGDFNNKWADVMKRQEGLTQAQRSEMFRDRKMLEAKQAKWSASQQMYERDHEVITKDRAKANRLLDDPTFAAAEKNFWDTGDYEGGLAWAPLNYDSYIDKNKSKWSGNDATKTVTWEEGGKTYTDKVANEGNIEEAKSWVENDILADNTGRKLDSAVQKFIAQPDEVKAKYLLGFDGEADTQSEKNAIINFARDYWGEKLMKTSTTTTERPTRTSASQRTYTYTDGKIIDKNGDQIIFFEKDASGNVVGKGKGLNAIKLKVAPDSLMSGKGKKLSEEFGGEIKNDIILVTPTSIGNTVKLMTTSPIIVAKESKSLRDAPSGTVPKNGIYKWEEKIPSGAVVSTKLDNVSTELSEYLGNEAFQQAMAENFPQVATPQQTEGTPQVGEAPINLPKLFKKVKDYFNSPAKPKEEVVVDDEFSQFKR